MEPRELLRLLMQRSKDNPNSLATKLHNRTSQPQLHKFLTGISKEPRRSTLVPVAEHYDVPLDAFYDPDVASRVARQLRLEPELDQAGGTAAEDPAKYRAEKIPSIRGFTGELAARYVPEDEYDCIIPQYEVRGSMGRGVLLRDQPGLITSWHVTPEWVQKNVHNFSSPSNLAIVTGFGDSMKPMYNPGDPLLVDIGVKTVEFDGVYFFRIGEEGFIKRLQRVPGQGLVAISENKAYRDWVIDGSMDFEVFARVVKVWRGDDY